MKQRKDIRPEKPQDPKALRQEIDHCVKQIVAHVSKDPKKVATIFEAWIAKAESTRSKKDAA